MLYVISACLTGENCKYNGGNNYREEIAAFRENHLCLLVCPEWAGELDSPREPAEIIGGSGEDVLEGRARVVDRTGKDVTEAFLKGATISMDAVEEVCEAVLGESLSEKTAPRICAVLKAKSPSCGSGTIYDGSFTGRKIPGDGVTAALFKRKGIRVLTEEEFAAEIQTCEE